MLYPNFEELLTFQKSKGRSHAYRSVSLPVTGTQISSFRGPGLEFDGVREYVPGDDIRNIDWRVTARTGSPHLKLFQEERERHIVLCIDMNARMRFGTKNTFKSIQAARAAAFLGWQGFARQDRVSACLFGDIPNGVQFFAPKRSRSALLNILKMLTKPSSEEHIISLEKALLHVSESVHTGSLVYIISDFMDMNEIAIQRLTKKCDLIFIAINDPAEESLDPIGTLRFCTQEGEFCVNTDSMAGRAAYAAAWQENRAHLRKISRQLKIPLLELTTKSDVRQSLVLGLKNSIKRKR